MLQDLTVTEWGKVKFTQHLGTQTQKRNCQEKKAVSFHLTDHSIPNAKNNLLLIPDFYQAGRFGCGV